MALIYVVEDDKNIQEIETFALANVGYLSLIHILSVPVAAANPLSCAA